MGFIGDAVGGLFGSGKKAGPTIQGVTDFDMPVNATMGSAASAQAQGGIEQQQA